MGTVQAHTTAFDFDADNRPGETVLDTLRRLGLPAQGFLLRDPAGGFVSLAQTLAPEAIVHAHSLRNPDFSILNPAIEVASRPGAVAEIFAAQGEEQALTLVQFTRDEGIDYVYAGVAKVLDGYFADHPAARVQIALSGGGDGRIVGECVGRYAREHPGTDFHAVITANGFEDETEHLTSATAIANRFGLPYTVFNEADSAKELGWENGFDDALARYRNEFAHDEAEILATYWVQELNRKVAKDNDRTAIVFGFNLEDVIAERLYQAVHGHLLDPYPVRTVDGLDLIAPLYLIPKRLIDALDVDNSMRNYDRRQPSVSYLRSAMYFLAYLIAERFPTLAHAFADPTIIAQASEEIPEWLLNKPAE